MPVASPAAAMMADIGSGTHHAADIVIGIVVGVVLIVFLVSYFLSRRGRGEGGDVRAAADARDDEQRGHISVGGSTVAEATLRLSRGYAGNPISGLLSGKNERWNIALDGRVVGQLAYEETVEVSVVPGHHSLRLGQGRHLSPRRSFDVADGEVVSYRCHGPRFPPVFLAGAIKPDLWIALKRN
jgi:hypothetical protein